LQRILIFNRSRL